MSDRTPVAKSPAERVAMATPPSVSLVAAPKKKPLARGQGNISVNAADKRSQSDIDLGEQKIDGVLYKPSVFYVLARGEINFRALDFKQNFTDRIVKQALKLPF